MPAITYRYASHADFVTIEQLVEQFRNSLTRPNQADFPKIYDENFLGKGRAIILAQEGQTVIGMVAICEAPERQEAARLSHLWVDPAYRMYGIATHLVSHALDFASQNSYTACVIHLLQSNSVIRKIFHELGFQNNHVSLSLIGENRVYEFDLCDWYRSDKSL